MQVCWGATAGPAQAMLGAHGLPSQAVALWQAVHRMDSAAAGILHIRQACVRPYARSPRASCISEILSALLCLPALSVLADRITLQHQVHMDTWTPQRRHVVCHRNSKYTTASKMHVTWAWVDATSWCTSACLSLPSNGSRLQGIPRREHRNGTDRL